MTVLLSGIVGSTAYGLARPGSDMDRLGMYAAPTTAFHGLLSPAESIVTHEPDITLHEAGKYVRLALGGNPTAMELMWLESYEVQTPLGDELIGIRTAFLSAQRVRDAYLGYAEQQFRKLVNRDDGSFSADLRNRTPKHARHLARLIHQGIHLYRTGDLMIRLDNPGWYHEFGERVANGEVTAARWLLRSAEADFDTIRSPLPEHPDEAAAEAWLQRVRSAHYEAPPTTGQVFLVDLDGTVALRDDQAEDVRTPYMWDRVGEDLPNGPIITVVRALAAAGHGIVYMSGRSDAGRAPTNVWIAHHIGVAGLALHMRPIGDDRADEIVKRELYDRWVKPVHKVTAVIDDRKKVVRMWRDIGLPTLQVADGEF